MKKKNTNAETNEWFRSCVRYTMMGAADINGFIPGACQCVLRNETSDEGAAGTVDTAFFKNGLKLTFVLFLAIT